jgi:hypothetical protein
MSVDIHRSALTRLRSSTRHHRVAAALGVIVVAACLPVAIAGHGPAALVCAVALVCVVSLPLVWRLRTDILDGPGVYGLATLVFFGLSSLAWLHAPPSPGPNLVQADVTQALLLVAGATAIFTAVAWATARPRPTPRLRPPREPASRWALLACYAVGLAVLAAGVLDHAYGYVLNLNDPSTPQASVQAFNSIGSFAPMAVLATALLCFSLPGRPFKWMLVAMIAAEAAFGFIAGFKAASIDPFALVFLAYVVTRRRFPWVPIVAAVLIGALVLVPANEIYRAALRARADAGSRQSPYDPSLYRPDHLISRGASKSVDYFFTRFRQIDQVALVVSQTPSPYPYGSGARYLEFPLLLLVPRAVWPDKPVLDDSDQFSTSYWQLTRFNHTSTGVTQIGDLYRNFGVAGSLIGLAVLALVLALATRLYHRFFSFRALAIWCFVLYRGVAELEQGLPVLLSSFLKALPFAALAAWLLLPGRTAPAGYRQIARRLAALRVSPS